MITRKHLKILHDHFENNADQAEFSHEQDRRVRGFLALCIQDKQISVKKILEMDVFQEYLRKNEDAHDALFHEVLCGIEDELLDVIDEMKEIVGDDGHMAYPIRLENADGEVKAEFQGTLLQLGEYIKQQSAGISSQVNRRMQAVFLQISKIHLELLKKHSHSAKSFFSYGFSLDSSGSVLLWIRDEQGLFSALEGAGDTIQFWFIDHGLDMATYIQKIGYAQDGDFSLEEVLVKNTY